MSKPDCYPSVTEPETCATHNRPMIDAGGCRVAREATQREAAERQTAKLNEWTAQLGSTKVTMTIDDLGDVELWFNRDSGNSILIVARPSELCQLGIVMLDASRAAGQWKAKQLEKRGKR